MKLALAAILLAATACSVVEVDAEIRAACSTRHDLDVAAAPAAGLAGDIDLALEVELAELAALAELDAELRIDHVRLVTIDGIDDLGFVASARITMASAAPDAVLPTVTLVDCAGDCPRGGADLLLPSTAAADALDYAAAGPLAIDLAIRGELPPVAWSVDVEVCASGNLAL